FEPALPRTATEEILAGVWSEVLGLERVGTREDFFALGGHSLLATRVAVRLRETFGVELPLRSLFEHPTVESLAATVDAALRSGLRTAMPAIAPGPRTGALSFAQQRLWFLDQLDPGNPAYNVPVALRLRGDLDVAALARTLSGIAWRHEVLRTRFAVEDGRAVAVVEPFASVPLPTVDLSGLGRWEETAAGLMREEAGRRFDLERGPLMRAFLMRLGPDDHLALLSTHHIVSDAWSMDVLVREVASLYGGAELPDLPVQYADYAAWQRRWLRGETLEAHLAWWRARLAGASPVLGLPADRPRPAVQSFRGASHGFELPDLAGPLRAFARREGATLFMALLAAFQALLHRVTGQDDLSLGTPVAGREHLRTEDLIGFFVNTLVLRAEVDPEASVLALLRETRESVLEAFVHQDLPLDLLVEALRPERDLSWQPLFQAVFAFEPGAAKVPELPGLALEPLAIPGGAAKFDLSLTVVDDGALRGAFVYAAELFDATTLARLGGHFEAVVRGLVESPSTPLAELALLSAPERHQLLREWSDTEERVEAGTVVDRFLAQAERTPDAEAVAPLTYGELARRSGELACHLSGLGVGPEVRVGLCLDRTPELAVALFGIWRAGGAYVPLDPSYPDARLALLLEDSGAAVVVTEERWRDRLAGVRRVSVESLGEERGPERRPAPEDLAYLIYTSGTTGRPKAVMVEHGSLANLLDGREAVGRMPCLAAYTFDIFLFELLSPLLSGGTSVLYSLTPTLDVDAVAADLAEMTHLHAVPAVMRQIVDRAGEAPRLRELFVGGDAVPSDLLAAMRERFPAARVRALYGPTEATILATSSTEGPGSVIGRPLKNVRLRLTDRFGSEVPIGVAGEIRIGGAGVSRGYLGQEELTRERFVEADGERWYRSGDLGRWRPDGTVEFLGRSDDQVKVRGFRIELGEVESAMARHPGVRAAAAAVRAGRLVGWYVGEAGDLRPFLESELPAALVPSALVELESLPLTPHGKVDRRALPDPEQTATEAVAPRTQAEEILAGIWSDLLGLDRVGVHDSFFDLGGHSLLATQLVSRVREAFAVELPLARLFEAPTVAGLAEAVAARQDVPTAPPLEPVDRRGDLPLSFAQERIWFFEQLEPGTPTYHLPLALRLEGEVDAEALARIFGAIVERHEALRTVFVNPGGEPSQRVEPVAAWHLPVVSGPLESLAEEEARRPFDLGRGPLLRTTLVRLGEREHVLLLTLHHIASDAWSMGVLVDEVQRLWMGETLRPLPVQYGDYAVWQRRWLQGETLERMVDYWRGHLAGAPALLELPADRPRPAVQSFRGAAGSLELGERVSEGLRALARGRSATLFMVLLAGFEALLGRLSGQDDLVVGTPIAGRTRRELEPLIGFFVNTLALRADLSGDPTFGELVGRARRAALAGYEHQDLPFEKLVEELQPERSLGHAPLFQAMFVLQNAPLGPVELPGVHLRSERTGTVAAEHDWTLETWDVDGRIRASLQYRTDLFDEATIRRALGHLETLLEAAVEDPRQKLWDLPLLRPMERQQIVSEWGEGGATGSGEVPVHERIAQLAAERPGAPAVIFADGVLSFSDLVARSRRLALELAGLGISPESVVALCVERSPEMAIGILGALAAGGAYLPLDPSHPKERLAFLLEDSGADVVLTQHRLLGALPTDGPKVLCLDDERPAPAAVALPAVLPDQAAYVIYTSGSTGRPKGAVVSHRALSVYTETIARELDLGPDDRMLQFASPAFDVVVEELFPAWSSGAAVVLREPEALATGAGLRRVLAEDGVTVCELPTAFWHEWVYELARTGEPLPESLRLVLIGGEHVLPERLTAWSHLGVPLVHVYGLTETTVTSTTWSVPAGWAPPSADFVLPIGRPVPGTRVLVLDRNLQPVPAGVAGELCLGGAGLGRGYVGRPDLTAERFVPSENGRLYRTGDLARWRSDGALEFLGRLDQQVKVRGFRVEPGEVEAVLARHPAVREVSVVARAQRLIAYVVLGDGGAEDLRRHLQGSLPDYMVPSAFVVLPALPRTATGKLDRRALPEPVESAGSGDVRPRTATEEILAGLWSEVLGLERVGTREDFFALGGHSLLATRVISRLRETFGVELPLRALFEHPTVESLAAAVDHALRSGLRSEMPALVPAPWTGALSFAQQRLWFLDQLDPGNPAYNVPVALRLRGALDTVVLARTLSEIARRHEVLRTRFAAEDGRAVAVVEPFAPVPLPVVDLSGAEDREALASLLVVEEAERRFDLERGPLMRASLVRLGPDDHLALFSTHHIVSDAWSMDVLVKEVASLYSGSSLPELPVQYADYAAWQRSWLQGEVLEEHLAYWRTRLAGASPVLDLPTDRPRPPVQSFRGASHAFAIPDDLAAGLRELSRREGTTLFMTLLAGFESLLLHHSRQEDFCVGTPVAGRNLLALEDLIGFFVNTLVLRADLADCGSFRDLLRRCREASLGAFSHAEMPLDRLVEELQPERRADNQPLFQVMFAFETEQERVLLLPGLTFSPVEVHESRAKFDLTLTFSEAGGALGAGFSFACDLFDATTVARLGERLVTLLRALAERPDEPFRTVSLLGEAERHQTLAEWNDTAFASAGGTVVERFAAQAARTPGAPAVEAGGSVLSYGDLARRSGDLARHLRTLGVGPETRVGLCLDRTADLAVGLLGIWKAGGAYVAMEPSYPDARLALLLEDSAAPVVVTERRWRDRLAAMTQVPLVCADEVEPTEGAEASPGPRDLAYLIYTSGTTGRPKAVMVEHGSLANLLDHTGRIFGFAPGDRMPCLAAYTFDIFLFELLSPLLSGGTSVLYGLRPTLDVEAVAARLPEMTHLHAVPAVMRQIVDLAGEAPSLRELFVGGDLVPPDLLSAMRERFPAARVHVLYGPTEGTILASSHHAESIGPRPVIGRPLGNMVLRLVDKAGAPSPIGIAGEIWIGGAGVSRGYLGQEELTREKFVEDGDGRWYRTGDFARWLADGGIEFQGRSDDQVKIRGFRIELAEVESVLAQHPAVRTAAAAARGEGEARRLVGYFVPAETVSAISTAVLREFLEERLPAHMVPSALVELEALPLTPHGKVDRRALPDPERSDEEAGVYVPPRTPAEELLAGLWAEVLKQPRVGVHDNFFDLGGHSLLATQLISRVREAFDVELPLVRIFEAPTVAGLAEVLATGSSSADKAKSDPILPAPRDQDLPLSFSQERVWFFEQLEPGTSAYNLPLALRIEGDLTPALLSALLEAIARRHEPLRTSFPERNGEPVQEIAPPGEWLVPVVDLSGLENRLEVALAIGTREAQRPFELAAGPLLRTRLLRLGPDDQILLFNMHHIVSDGWSMGVLMHEFSELYRAYRTGVPPELPDLPVQYADYSVWQREWMKGEVLERQLDFWRGQLDGAPAILDLPTDRPRPAFMSFRGGTEYFRLDAARMAALHALARRRGTTMFMVLLAAFDALVGRHTSSGDVVVGSPIANRTRSEVENLIGFFVNTILLRVSVAGDPTFLEILDRVRRATLAAYGHQDLPFEKLVEALQPDRNLGETPLFQVMFVLQNAPAGAAGAEDLKITPVETPGEVAAEFDWTVELVDASEGLLASLQYRRDLFDQATIQRVARRFEVLLDSLSAEPERHLSDLVVLTESERHQLAAEWNDTQSDEPGTLLVWESIAAWADRRPEAPAVIGAGRSLSYRELVDRAGRLAAELSGLGVGPEVVVALFLERSPETAVGILGVLAAGGVYVPLDPAYPRDRITFTLEDSGARVVLTQRRLLGSLPADGLTVLCLDEERETASASEPVLIHPVHPENAAYIIYTSGSTGRPKGAVITHRALAVYVEAISRELGLVPDDRMLQFASPGFDVVVEEIFPAWASGAAVVLRESEAFATGEGLLRVIAEDGVTACELPTAFWHEWVYELARTERELPASLRFVIIGGEHVIPERLAAWARFGVPLVHVYGLTETTVTSTTWNVPAGWTPPSEDFVLPIGRPIGAARVTILDRSLEPAPLGVPGELCIAGDALARGYFGRPDLTAERFAPGLFGERVYRTGDLARYRADGAVEFLGRLDHQVKIRGFRIELGEIEAALGRHPAVREVAVLARKGPDGMPRLVAYLALGADVGSAELRPYLQELLPEYMIPGVFVPLEALPRTATGKVDRKALPEVELQSDRAYVAPRDPTEELLAVLWTQVLGVERVGVEDDFFGLGGHSLLATRLMARVREAFGVDVPLRSLFESSSLAGLAQEVRTIQRSGSGLAMPPIEPVGRTEPLPLSFAQQRLWFLGQLEPDNPAYNVPIALRVTGDLDVRVFDRTLGEIVRRHESLRTRFGMDGADPVQVIDPAYPWRTPVIDLGALPADVREREVFRLATEEAQTPFDLARGPLLRVRLLALAPGERVVLFSMHHIVSDAWSMEVLVGEMAPLYSAFLRGEGSPLPELPIQYADYAAWQRRWLQGEVLEKHLAYWKEQLAGAAQVLELPTDRPRPSFQTFRGATFSFDLPPALAQALRAVAREESATLFMTLLAPLEWLLSRYSGQQDFCVGTPIAGRNHLETEGLIGFFVNTLVLRADLSSATGPRDLLRRGRDVVLGAFSHQDLPFEKLVEEVQPERDLARHPLFQAVFALETEREDASEAAPPIGDGLAFAPLEFEGTAAKFDWALSVVDFGERLSVGIDYMADLFDETTIRRMAAHYERLAAALAEEPWRALDETPLLAAGELQQVVREWSD
ncbi:MAG: non-ribosomal peptide synthase/polyketide synthase, partial [Acidobacteriota bacterium]